MKQDIKDALKFLIPFILGLWIGLTATRPLEEPAYPSMVPEFFSRGINSTGGGL